MRRLLSVTAAAALTVMTCAYAAAQPVRPSGPDRPGPDSKNMEQLESAKIGFFTTRMNLTQEEAARFWPVYNEYHKAVCDARKAARDNFKAIKELSNKKNYPEVEMKRLLIKYTEGCAQDDELERLYLDEFLKILPVEKVAAMYIAEEEFRAKMIKMWKKPESAHHTDHEKRP
ncbi:MAG TPA: hypothetical protein IAC04_02050 [Candidatus Coprenecus stercoravium]|uniref:Uncharacterized protein n=1 Tax=Candidatus Coprenecus stercoravium TaxID=2840735 RepID=A0A9D2GQT7_9BACT|nr:hypothetical protein [Candidatus Coprenecus stercoravium]